MKVTLARLSRTLEAVIRPDGSVLLLRNERPAFNLSTTEAAKLHATLELDRQRRV